MLLHLQKPNQRPQEYNKLPQEPEVMIETNEANFTFYYNNIILDMVYMSFSSYPSKSSVATLKQKVMFLLDTCNAVPACEDRKSKY